MKTTVFVTRAALTAKKTKHMQSKCTGSPPQKRDTAMIAAILRKSANV